MAATQTKKIGPRMSDEAVKAKTGKTWQEWFSLLDLAGARKMSHQEIVKLLNSKHDVGPWWCQMVTVNYEQQRGLRAAHQRPDGYQISVSRTLDVSVAQLFKAFASEKSRSAWLQEELKVRKTNPNKSMRATWKDGKTSLEINFYPKPNDRSQVVVQHGKLPNAAAAAKMKTYWAKALERLKASAS